MRKTIVLCALFAVVLLASSVNAVPPGCIVDTFSWPAMPVSTEVDTPISGIITSGAPVTTDLSIGAVTGQIYCPSVGAGVIIHNENWQVAYASCNAEGWQNIEFDDYVLSQVRNGNELSVWAEAPGIELSAGSFELISCGSDCANDNKNCITDANCNPGSFCFGGSTLCSGYCHKNGVPTNTVLDDNGVECAGCKLFDLTVLYDGTFAGPRNYNGKLISIEAVQTGESIFTAKPSRGLFKQMAALLNSESPFSEVVGGVVINNDGVTTTEETWIQSETSDTGLGQGQEFAPEPEEKEKVCTKGHYCVDAKKTVKLCSSDTCKTDADCFNKSPDPNMKNKVPKYYRTVQDYNQQGQKSGRPYSVGLTTCGNAEDCKTPVNGIVDCK